MPEAVLLCYNESAMIGFFKESDFIFWLKQVRQWIKNADWDNAEMPETVHFKIITS